MGSSPRTHPIQLMDPPPQAHFLGLPRELRDKIYAYLHHTIHKNMWTRQNGPSPRIYSISRFTILNAPFPSLLRTHSQLASEYREAACCTDAMVSVKVLYARNEAGYRPEPPWPTDLLQGRLSNVRRVTVYLDIKYNETCVLAIRRLQQILSMLESRSPNLAVFRLAVRGSVRDGMWRGISATSIQTFLDAQSSGLVSSAAAHPKIAPTSPPNQLLDCAIRQRGEGYLFTYEERPEQETLHSSSFARPSSAEKAKMEYFSCSRVGLYVYSSAPVLLERDVWRREDIFDVWPMIPPRWERYNHTEAKVVLDNLNKVIRWREMRGGELQKWQGDGGDLDSWLVRMKEMGSANF